MKLKCDQHSRRVLTLPGNDSFFHRTGDMSKCDSKTASLKDSRTQTTRTFQLSNGELLHRNTDKKY